MAGTARRVHDFNGKEGFFQSRSLMRLATLQAGACQGGACHLQSICHHRLQGAVQQAVNQARQGVIAARRFALGTGRYFQVKVAASILRKRAVLQ